MPLRFLSTVSTRPGRLRLSGNAYAWLWCLPLLAWAAMPRAEVTVMVSIKPLELIAEEVVGERGRIDRLLPPGASPHEYPLRMSEMRRIQSADLVFWVGRELETFLHRPVSQLPAERRLAAGDLDALHWPSVSDDPHGHADGDHHHHGDRDPHLWLDPRNGGIVARALAERLAAIDPQGAEGYRSRAEALVEELTVLDATLADRLEPIKEQGFAVYHEGYGHFVQRYGLKQVASVTFTPERRPGARHLYRIRQQLGGAVCLFAEPYYDMGTTESLARELNLRLGELDLLGASDNIRRYPDLLERMADDFLACLSL